MSSSGSNDINIVNSVDDNNNSSNNNNNQSLVFSNNTTITLTDLFEYKSVYVNVATESNPLGEIRGRVVDALALSQ
jgi:hypothetical protein